MSQNPANEEERGAIGAAEPVTDAPGPLRALIDTNFLQYASYVIRDRAIPYLDDGLKPVQRRILYSLQQRDDGRFIKVASVVGHCMQYHPHGDASITDALVTLVNKGYLVEGQGNFGNLLTGDPAAAARYIECRLTELARREVFNDDLTKFIPSYDGRNQEPVTLPTKLPLLLMLGADGIAVGLSTRILPHNFIELLEAQIAILEKRKFKILPDFLQGGIMDVSEYDDGMGRVRLRAKIEERDAQTLVISEIPYSTTTESITASIEDAARKKKVAVKSIDDYTSEHVEIALTLEKDAKPAKMREALYAFTSCETSLNSHPVVIHDDRPDEMPVSEILKENTRRLVETLKQELNLKKRTLLDEFHTKTLIQIFVENRIYKRIEECKTYPEVQQAILDGLAPFRNQLRRDVTQPDVEMLLGVRIRRISLFDINKNRKDIEAILKDLDRVEKELTKLTAYAIRYLKDLLKTYGAAYPRRTVIKSFEEVEIKTLTARELQISYDRESGYLGTAIQGDAIAECSSYDKLVLLWSDGRYRVVPPPEKLFVDKHLLYCAAYDRDRELMVVYTDKDVGFTYMKRFTLGGAIMDRDYTCTAGPSTIRHFQEGSPDEIYVKYKPAKRQRIDQQVFHPADMPVKGVKAHGNQMTAKPITRLTTKKPHGWTPAPRGQLT